MTAVSAPNPASSAKLSCRISTAERRKDADGRWGSPVPLLFMRRGVMRWRVRTRAKGRKGPRRKLIGRDGSGASRQAPASSPSWGFPCPLQCRSARPTVQVNKNRWLGRERPSRQGSSCQLQPARCRRPAQPAYHWTHFTLLAAKSDGGRDVSLLRTLSVLQLLLHRAAAPSLSAPPCTYIPAHTFQPPVPDIFAPNSRLITHHRQSRRPGKSDLTSCACRNRACLCVRLVAWPFASDIFEHPRP